MSVLIYKFITTMKKTFVCALGIGAMMMLQSCYVLNVSVGMSENEPA